MEPIVPTLVRLVITILSIVAATVIIALDFSFALPLAVGVLLIGRIADGVIQWKSNRKGAISTLIYAGVLAVAMVILFFF